MPVSKGMTRRPSVGKSGPSGVPAGPTGAPGGSGSSAEPRATKLPMMGSRPSAAQRAAHGRVSGRASASLANAAKPKLPTSDMRRPGGLAPASSKQQASPSKAGARRDALKRMLK